MMPSKWPYSSKTSAMLHGRGADGAEHRQRVGAVEHHRRRPHQRTDIERRLRGEDVDQVLADQHADDLVGLALMHRQHGVMRGAQRLLDLLGRIGQVDHLDVEPRRHQAARRAIGEAHDARDHRLFFALEHALALGLGDDGLDLFVGDAVFALPGLADQRHHPAARNIEQPHQRRRDRSDELHRRCGAAPRSARRRAAPIAWAPARRGSTRHR